VSLLAPLGLAFLGFIPAVVVLYFLRLKRDIKVVSSTYLWKKAVDEFRVNRPFQRFQNHLLLWLQILAIAALSLAASRPYVEARQAVSDVHLVLVDHSASMSTREEGGHTRLDLAKEAVREMVRGMRSADRMMIIGFSDRANVVAPLTADRDVLLRAIDDLHPTSRPTRIDEAWLTALSVGRQYDLSDVYLFSDGGFRTLPPLVEAHANVHYAPVGRSTDNAGVVHVETRASEESKKRVEVFARVFNRRSRDANTLVELHLNDRLVDAQKVTVPAGAERGVIFQRPSTDAGVVEVRLPQADDFDADNRAWIPLGAQETVRVVLVGEENVFLKQAIAMDPRVELTIVSPADYEKLKDKLAEFDLLIFDGVDPGALGRGNALVFGRVPAMDGFAAKGELEQPALLKWDSEHPLTQYINFSSVHVAKAVESTQPAWMKTLLSSDKAPIIAAGERGGLRLAVVAFRVLDSDWPLRVSFPLFFANAARWAREEDLAAASAVKPGEPLPVRVPRDASRATLTPPAGEPRELVPGESDRVLVADTETPGVYRVRWEGRKTDATYAVSLSDPGESDIGVPDRIAMGETELKGRVGSALVRKEFTSWLVIAGVVLLVIEWLVYQFYRK
jgi:hypothetical protein